jgi:hypothetical protein
MIVLVTMVLHNYIREHTSGDIDFERVEHDEDYELTDTRNVQQICNDIG